MDLGKLSNIYLIGIGGIGMSALARYFREKGLRVSGYDRTETALTQQLAAEGMEIVFSDDVAILDKAADLVIYTPAIPKENVILNWYRENNYPVYKRSDVLQWITEQMSCISVAGTHGKTTITTLIAYLLRNSDVGGSAFLGGVCVNYDTNYWKTGDRNLAVVEADEYDRSFLKLSPDIAVLTAMDADHLDIYGNVSALEDAFVAYTEHVKPDGVLWYKHGLPVSRFATKQKKSYSLQNDAADAWAANIRMDDGSYWFDWHNQCGTVIEGLKLNLGGMHNVENAVVAIAVALEMEAEPEQIKNVLPDFKGVKRRFEYVLRTENLIYIDDYAHHPKELYTLIQSAKRLFPDKKCTVAFQPHLYSRTQDMAAGFAESLDAADEVILLPVYPAREAPIPGVSSALIKEKMTNPVCTELSKKGLLQFVEAAPLEIFITAGAGDISFLVDSIKNILQNKRK